MEEMGVGASTWKGKLKSLQTRAMTGVRRQTATRAGEEGKLEPSCGAGRIRKMGQPLWKMLELPYDPAVSLLGLYVLKKIKTYVHTRAFIHEWS